MAMTMLPSLRAASGRPAGTGVFGGAEQGFRVLQEVPKAREQGFGGEAVLGHHPCAAGIGDGVGVAFLLLVGVVRIGHEDCGTSGGGDFGDCPCP